MIKFAKIVKPAPIFGLFNHFLIWIKQKVLVLSNFDLLLTKYYKKRLKPKLKKKREKQLIIYQLNQLNWLACNYLPTGPLLKIFHLQIYFLLYIYFHLYYYLLLLIFLQL